jgi:hypothetical protein
VTAYVLRMRRYFLSLSVTLVVPKDPLRSPWKDRVMNGTMELKNSKPQPPTPMYHRILSPWHPSTETILQNCHTPISSLGYWPHNNLTPISNRSGDSSTTSILRSLPKSLSLQEASLYPKTICYSLTIVYTSPTIMT